MVDSTHLTDVPTAVACTWCSADVTAETATCPSCGAILISEQEHDLPGVTAVDESIARAGKRPTPTRGRFLSWFGGEHPDKTTPALTPGDAQAIAPPDDDVQREILRLQLAAQISNLQAEADSILSDALVEGRVDELPDGLRPLAAAEASAETPEETADALVVAALGDDAATEPDAEAGVPATDAANTDTADTEADQPA